MALPALAVVLAAGLWGVSVGTLQARCVAAARGAALAAARGEADTDIAARVRAGVGADATVSLTRVGGTAAARVSARRPAFGIGPAWPVTAEATARLEPGGNPP